MNLNFNIQLAENYKSLSQISRILSEAWVHENVYCPRCGNSKLEKCKNNRPVTDFICNSCKNQIELKCKARRLGHKIDDGTYDTMIKRITSNQNPDFFFLTYSKTKYEYKVKDFIFISKYFFIPRIIEKRNPLSPKAKRAGWTGCKILIDEIPEQGRISIIKNGIPVSKNDVLKQVETGNLLNEANLEARGWLMDVLNCINRADKDIFALSEIYSSENELQKMHPNNHNIQPKIRQQLQFLRNKGFIEFLGNGKYRKIK